MFLRALHANKTRFARELMCEACGILVSIFIFFFLKILPPPWLISCIRTWMPLPPVPNLNTVAIPPQCKHLIPECRRSKTMFSKTQKMLCSYRPTKFILLMVMDIHILYTTEFDIRGVVNQECESLHKTSRIILYRLKYWVLESIYAKRFYDIRVNYI